jgi:hypothetical protein
MLVIYVTLPITITLLGTVLATVGLLWSMTDRRAPQNGLRPLPVTDGVSRPRGIPRPAALTAPALPPRRNVRPSPMHEAPAFSDATPLSQPGHSADAESRQPPVVECIESR